MSFRDLDSFWRAHPHFVYAPAAVAAGLHCLWYIPCVASFFASQTITPWGVAAAAHYTGFAILLAFATHGCACVLLPCQDPTHKLQAKAFEVSPMAAATRCTAVLLTEMIYAFLPARPPSSSWVEFWGCVAALVLTWDFEFFVVHKLAHDIPALYRRVHKLHHAITNPNCFAAYFVTYQSHLLLEQLVVISASIAFAPRDVVAFVLYTGTLATYMEHSGFEFEGLRVPLARGITLGHVLTLSCWFGMPLGLMRSEHHDWHHERFVGNYALYFTYLDKLAGSFHPGRVPGAASANKNACDERKSRQGYEHPTAVADDAVASSSSDDC